MYERMAYSHIRHAQLQRKYSVAVHEHRVKGTYRDFVQYQARCMSCAWIGKLREYESEAAADAKRHGVAHAKAQES